MKRIRKPVKQIVVGTYESMKAASKQVDLLMRLNTCFFRNRFFIDKPQQNRHDDRTTKT